MSVSQALLLYVRKSPHPVSSAELIAEFFSGNKNPRSAFWGAASRHLKRGLIKRVLMYDDTRKGGVEMAFFCRPDMEVSL